MANLTYQVTNFRADTYQKINAYISSICNALITVNPSVLTQTADTGQHVWGSLASLPADDTVYGYNIFEFDDGIGTQTFFLKFEWLVDTTYSWHKAYLTIGTGSDGAGNLTGIFFPQKLIFTGSTSNITDAQEVGTSRIIIDEGLLCLNLWSNNSKYSNFSHIFIMSRPKDSLGAFVDGRLIVYANNEVNPADFNVGIRRYSINTVIPSTMNTDIPSEFCVLADGLSSRPIARDGSYRYVKSVCAFPDIYADPHVIISKASYAQAQIMPTGPAGEVFVQMSSINDGTGSAVAFVKWS